MAQSLQPHGLGSPVNRKAGSARRARKEIRVVVLCASLWLQKRFLSGLVAICTQPMRWFSTASVRLQHISDAATPNVLKLVILLLCPPCFEASHFFFKIAYLANQRRLRLAGLHN